MVLISKGSNLEKVDEFIHFLSFSNFERWNMSIDNLWRKLLQIIDETQRELTLNELLASEESANLALKTKFEDFNSIPPKSHKKHRKSNSSYQIKPQNNGNCYSHSCLLLWTLFFIIVLLNLAYLSDIPSQIGIFQY